VRRPSVLDWSASRHTTFLKAVGTGRETADFSEHPPQAASATSPSSSCLFSFLINLKHLTNQRATTKRLLRLCAFAAVFYPAGGSPQGKQRAFAWLDASSHASLTCLIVSLNRIARKETTKRLIHYRRNRVQPL
jgi:hypothetical protein